MSESAALLKKKKKYELEAYPNMCLSFLVFCFSWLCMLLHWRAGVKKFLVQRVLLKALLYNILMSSGYEHLINTAAQFTGKTVTDIRPLSGGHINESFLVTTDADSYVLQCLNSSLYSEHLTELEGNYLQYRAACERAGVRPGEWICPEWFKNRSGRFFHTDADGIIWRSYRLIPGDAPAQDELYEAGAGLGRLHRILRGCDTAAIRPILPDLHNLRAYYDKYLETGDVPGREAGLDRAISDNIDKMLDVSVPTDAVIHGDAKISNMIMQGGNVVGFIDLDTLMPGSVYDDLADCIRSCCIRDNGEVDMAGFDMLLNGYEAGVGTKLPSDMRELALMNVMKNRFMLGLRYYTDCLTGSRYFIETRPGQNLQKAKQLLASNTN